MKFHAVILILCIVSTGMMVSAANVSLKGGIRGLGTYSINPDTETLYPDNHDTYFAGVVRLLADINFTPSINLEINTVHDVNRSTAPPVNPAFVTGGRIPSAYRHPDLQWEWEEHQTDDYTVMGVSAFDRLNVQFESDQFGLRIGRQPINLTACFYLTPNDFFQPFSAQSFNRIYKPGVDAIRLNYFQGELTEFDLIGAAGYDGNDHLNWDESALLLRGLIPIGMFELAASGGKLAGRYVTAVSCQGEIGNFGIRGEGNISFPDDNDKKDYIQFAVGTDRRFSNTLHLFAEYMFLGNGAGETEDYIDTGLSTGFTDNPYLGRHYLAVSAAYEFHPLVNGGATVISNLADGSLLLAGTLTISLADEADTVIGVQVPMGDEPVDGELFPDIQSEYGIYPASIFAEIRYFF
jgi:hypothetical protein